MSAPERQAAAPAKLFDHRDQEDRKRVARAVKIIVVGFHIDRGLMILVTAVYRRISERRVGACCFSQARTSSAFLSGGKTG